MIRTDHFSIGKCNKKPRRKENGWKTVDAFCIGFIIRIYIDAIVRFLVCYCILFCQNGHDL